MVVYKKLSLLAAIILTTVLGGGCGQVESPVAAIEGKSNKFSDDPEVKEKKAKAIELLIAKCTECGIAEEKARKYKPYFEELLDSSAENIAQDFYKEFPTKEAARTDSQEEKLTKSAVAVTMMVYRLKISVACDGIKNKEDLMDVLANIGLETQGRYTIMSLLDGPGILDSVISSLRNGFFNEDKLMEEFQHACADFVVARIEKGQR